MRVYNHSPRDSATIPSPRISALAETPDGTIWIGSFGKGLASFDPRLERFIRYEHNPADSTSLPDNRITALQVDLDGHLWIGTQNGLSYLNEDKRSFTNYHHEPESNTSLPHNWITAMEVDTEGLLWIGTNSAHLCSLAPGSHEFKTVVYKWFKPTRAGTNFITDLVANPNGEDIFVGMFPIGSFRYSKITGKVKYYGTQENDPLMVNKNAIWSVDIAENGILWLGAATGISLLDPQTGGYHFLGADKNDPNSISAGIVWKLSIDAQGIVWTGLSGLGVDVCNPNQLRFKHFNQSDPDYSKLESSAILGMDFDKQGRLWLARAGSGFQRIDLRQGGSLEFQTEDSSPAVWSMNYSFKVMVDQQDRVWMGTNLAGLFRWDPATDTMEHYRKYRLEASRLCDNDIFALYETRDGTIWVGTKGGGLHRYQPDSDDFEFIRHDPEDPNSLASDKIISILEDKRGDLWVGTQDAGLDRLAANTDTFQHYQVTQKHNSITSDIVRALYEDARSQLWIGTRGGGLCRLDSARETFDQMDLGFDPEDMEVSAILEDDHGNLWISSSKGILKFNVDQGLLGTYQEADGVQGKVFYYESSLKDSEGFIYFGGSNGLNRFHPDSIRLNAHIPPVILTDLWINHERVKVGEAKDDRVVLPKSIEYLDTLKLSYKDKVLRFEFTALDYWNPELNQYRYKLENFDPEWVEAGNTNMVTYTSLDPGWYTLRIIGSNNDRVWNDEGVTLAIFIKPPFWKTGLFRIFMVILILSLFMGIMMWRNWRLQVQNRRLEALVRQRTAELKVEMEERSRVEQEKTEQQIDHLRRELLTKTLHLSEKQSIMDSLHDNLQSLSSEVPPESRGSIRKLIRFLKSHLTVKEGWEDFELWFTQVHSGFYETLRNNHPNLSENELKVCALLRLNLVTKDVAKVMNIQTASINIYRHRIRKKINLQSEENLTTYLAQF
jgi:ligand-binding sensor domain-containing protein/DNA-binding CsgD family transcriptional regulator